MMKLRKHKFKKKLSNSDRSSKPGLIFQTHNPWNFRPELNQETQFQTNLMLKNEIIKIIINFKNKFKVKKITIKRIKTESYR